MSKFSGLLSEEKPKRTPAKKAQPAPARPRHVERRGRPAGAAGGKRSNPEYVAITAYLRKQTRLDVVSRLARKLPEDEEMDLSELIEKLLSGWLKRSDT